MPVRKERFRRTGLERHICEALLVELYFAKGGPKYTNRQATEDLNKALESWARTRSEQLGLDESGTKKMIESFRVSEETVKRDLRDLNRRVRDAAALGAAGLLDEQLEQVRDRIENEVAQPLKRLRDDENAIRSDIDRCRNRRFRPAGNTELSRLWRVLLHCADAREKLVDLELRLRQEERLLHFGQKVFENEESATNAETFAQALTGAEDPASARKLALAKLAEEVDRLRVDSSGLLHAMPPGVARAASARLRGQSARITAIKGLLDAVSKDSKPVGESTGHVIELSVRRDSTEAN